MNSIPLDNVVASALLAAVVLLLVLWPTRRGARRMLERWGVGDPTGAQIVEALGYLWVRRAAFVVLAVTLPPLIALIWPAGDDHGGLPTGILLPLLAAMLIGELVASLRPVRGVRVATLVPRTWRALLPGWAVGVTLALAVLAVVVAVPGLVAAPWARRYANSSKVDDPDLRAALLSAPGLLLLASVVVCLAALILLVFVAVRRNASADELLDGALRTRTARVGVALGFGWLGGLVVDGGAWLERLAALDGDVPGRPAWLGPGVGVLAGVVEWVTIVGVLAAWIWLAAPSRRRSMVAAA